LGGSHGKGVFDHNSDYDFRMYCEKMVDKEVRKQIFGEINELCLVWKAKNVKVDGVFLRTYAEVDEQLDLWFAGKGKLVPCVWTIWGYSIL